MPTTNIYSRGHWRNEFPMLALWCENPDNATSEHGRNYALHGFLSEHATNQLAGFLDRDRAYNAEEPARMWDAMYVPNGDYQVQVTEGRQQQGVFDFRIHLVRDGSLRGQRIIKYRREGTSNFRGFAFVTRTGGFRLWTRFASDVDEAYVNAAILLVRALGQVDDDLHDTSSPLVWSGEGRTLRIAWAQRCAVCNNLASNFDTPYVAFCATHRTVVPDPVEQPTPAPFQVVGEMIYDDNIRMPDFDESNLPRCELGTGQIQ